MTSCFPIMHPIARVALAIERRAASSIINVQLIPQVAPATLVDIVVVHNCSKLHTGSIRMRYAAIGCWPTAYRVIKSEGGRG